MSSNNDSENQSKVEPKDKWERFMAIPVLPRDAEIEQVHKAKIHPTYFLAFVGLVLAFLGLEFILDIKNQISNIFNILAAGFFFMVTFYLLDLNTQRMHERRKIYLQIENRSSN